MNGPAVVLSRVGHVLAEGGWDWAVIGGLAVSVRTEPRFTRDIDLAIAVQSDEEAEEVVRLFNRSGFLPKTIVEQDVAGRLATVRCLAPEQGENGIVVDFLFASSGIEPELVRSADRLEILQGVSAKVATVGHLIALKLLARDDLRRPQDAADLRALLRVAVPSDLVVVEESLELIRRRGFDRGRDLDAAYRTALRDFRP